MTSAAEDLAELGNAFLMASDPVAAEECFQSAVDLAPNIASAMNNLAWLRMERNEIDAATIDLIRRALVATPNDSSTLDTAGWLAYRQGRLRDMEGSAGALTLLQNRLIKPKIRPLLNPWTIARTRYIAPVKYSRPRNFGARSLIKA